MKTQIAVLLAAVLAVALSCATSQATIRTATSCSSSAVQSAITAAVAGDTVRVPAGSCTWSAYITITKKLAIIGADNKQTVITGPGFKIGNGTDGVRISSFSFIKSSNTTAIYAGATRSTTGSKNFRIDNCRFTGGSPWVQVDGRSTGVIDHNEFFKGTASGIYIMGDDEAAWSRATDLGSSDFVFLENNVFDTQGTQIGHFIYNNYGGRVVIRYNTFKETGGARANDWIDMHGYCHGSYDRGARAFEIYNNTLIRGYNGCCRGLFLRGGTGVVFNNTFNQTGGQFVYGSNAPIFMVDYRASQWEGTKTVCSSTCNKAQWCANGEGDPCCDQIGRGKDLCPGSSPCGQSNEPVYFWNNKNQAGTAVPILVDSGSRSYIELNEDYFIAQKPNYTPYTYPHPLVGGTATTTAATTTAGPTTTTTTVGTPPSPPPNFRIIPGT